MASSAVIVGGTCASSCGGKPSILWGRRGVGQCLRVASMTPATGGVAGRGGGGAPGTLPGPDARPGVAAEAGLLADLEGLEGPLDHPAGVHVCDARVGVPTDPGPGGGSLAVAFAEHVALEAVHELAQLRLCAGAQLGVVFAGEDGQGLDAVGDGVRAEQGGGDEGQEGGEGAVAEGVVGGVGGGGAQGGGGEALEGGEEGAAVEVDVAADGVDGDAAVGDAEAAQVRAGQQEGLGAVAVGDVQRGEEVAAALGVGGELWPAASQQREESERGRPGREVVR